MKALWLILIFTISVCLGCTQQPSEYYLFVGTYTDESSEGIYLYKFNTEHGSLDSLGAVASVDNPSYLAFSPDHTTLYAVNEMGDSSAASVSSFAFNREDTSLTFLNKQSSWGGAPCYISVDREGEAVFVGNYLGGSLAMFPVNDDGSLGEAQTVVQHEGRSINETRQRASHVHCTIISPDNNYLFVTDLGTDHIAAYPYNAVQNELDTEASSVFNTEPGAGPRHLTFHPNGRFAYTINELDGTVTAFEYSNGSLELIQTRTTIPDGYDGPLSGADIHLSPDGKFLYASNRENLNNIVIYRVDQDNGELEKVGDQITGGRHPRNFVIDPTGNYLLVANQNTNNITIFERNHETGILNPNGRQASVSQPVCLKMIPVH